MTDPALTTDRPRGTGLWSLIHAERAALAADPPGLTDEQWEAPSPCAGLTVREVPAHLTAGASLNTVRWLAGVSAAGSASTSRWPYGWPSSSGVELLRGRFSG